MNALPAAPPLLTNRWVQLSAGILGMVAVANFQYSWTLFVLPLQERHGWSRVEILDSLHIFFVLAQTWLVPFEGYLADRCGPRLLVLVGGSVAALAWAINSVTSSLWVLHVAQILSGCGSGIVYAVSIGNALKWFPDRRGLAAGLTAAAFGAGSAATVLPIDMTIRHYGHEAAFLWFGLGQGLVVVLAGLALRSPPLENVPEQQARSRDSSPLQVLKTPGFWMLYLMMTVGAIPGLLMMGQLAPMARDFGVAEAPVTILGISQLALPFALMLDRISGGLTRPVFGWLSDHIGREPAIFMAFAIEGASLFALILCARDPTMFVVMSGLAFFGWGAVFSLFPAVCGDMFGSKFATANYGLLYTAKGTASLLVTLANRAHAQSQNWESVFVILIAADWIAALLALLVLQPLRTRAKNDRA